MNYILSWKPPKVIVKLSKEKIDFSCFVSLKEYKGGLAI